MARQEQLDRTCMAFWIAMFDHELKDGDYRSGVVSGLAVLGLDVKRGGWRPAIYYTPILSAIVTVIRALVVYRAWHQRENAIQHLQQKGWQEVDARRDAKSVFSHTKKMVHRFMTLTAYGSEPNPMNRVLHMRTYGFKIRMETAAEGTVMWQGEKICIGQIHFTMKELRSMVHGLCESTRVSLLSQMLLLELDGYGNVREEHTQLPPLDMNSLYDNPVEMMEGWSFLKDTRNVFSVDGPKWLLHRVLQETRLRAAFTRAGHDPSSEHIWNSERVHQYYREMRTFKEQLFALVHLTGGAPARGTEIISVEHRNGSDGRGQRGVFVEDGLVAFVTAYHKGYRPSARVKIVHRYVPREVAEIVVYFLWLVQPFVEVLQTLVQGQNEFTSFMWEPEPEEQWGEEEDEENGWFGEEEEEEVRSEAADRDNEEEKQKEEVQAHNADGLWGSDRVRKVLQRESWTRMGAKVGTSVWRHIYPAIQREFTTNQDVVRTLGAIYEGRDEPDATEEARAKQSGHGRYIEEKLYGKLLSESPFHTVSERRSMRRVSVDWHRFLHFPSAWAENDMDIETRQHLSRMRPFMSPD